MIAFVLACSRAAPVAFGGCGAQPVQVQGQLASSKLDEVSGVAASRTHPGVFWVHNDSGDEARVFAVGSKGEDLGATKLTGVDAIDFEDMALLPGEKHDWLLLADIGDNRHKRDEVYVHRIAEPTPGAKAAPVETMTVRYPDGAHNAEVLLVDPTDRQLYILSKVKQGASTLYRLGTFRASPVTATVVASVELPGSMKMATGGEAHDGVVAIRSYTHVHLYRGKTVPQALASTPCDIGWVEEQQGEAITFVKGGLLTISEGRGAALNRVPIEGL